DLVRLCFLLLFLLPLLRQLPSLCHAVTLLVMIATIMLLWSTLGAFWTYLRQQQQQQPAPNFVNNNVPTGSASSSRAAAAALHQCRTVAAAGMENPNSTGVGANSAQIISNTGTTTTTATATTQNGISGGRKPNDFVN